MFTAIIKALGGAFVDKLIDQAGDLFRQYLNKEISKEQLRTQLLQVMVTTAGEIEKAHADSIARTYDSFIKAAAQNRMMTAVWAAAALSQLLVLLWHQVGISILCYFVGNKACWPSSGATVDWAYAILMFCLGGGAIALRTGPAKFDLDKLKTLIGR